MEIKERLNRHQKLLHRGINYISTDKSKAKLFIGFAEAELVALRKELIDEETGKTQEKERDE